MQPVRHMSGKVNLWRIGVLFFAFEFQKFRPFPVDLGEHVNQSRFPRLGREKRVVW